MGSNLCLPQKVSIFFDRLRLISVFGLSLYISTPTPCFIFDLCISAQFFHCSFVGIMVPDPLLKLYVGTVVAIGRQVSSPVSRYLIHF